MGRKAVAVKKEKYKASTRDFRRCITDVLNTKQVQILCKCMHTYARGRAASQEAIIKYRKKGVFFCLFYREGQRNTFVHKCARD